MTIQIKGKLQLKWQNPGSKSEGCYAILLGESEREWRLYRANQLPLNDPYFEPYEGATLCLEGVEEENGYFRVEGLEVVASEPLAVCEPVCADEPACSDEQAAGNELNESDTVRCAEAECTAAEENCEAENEQTK